MKWLAVAIAAFPMFASATEFLIAKQKIEILPNRTETLIVAGYGQSDGQSQKKPYECLLKHSSSMENRHISRDARFDLVTLPEPKLVEPNKEDIIRLLGRLGSLVESHDISMDELNAKMREVGVASFTGVVKAEFTVRSEKTKQTYSIECYDYNDFTKADVIQSFKEHGLLDWIVDPEL